VRVLAVVGIQDSVDVEEDDVDFHSREATPPVKPRVRTAADLIFLGVFTPLGASWGQTRCASHFHLKKNGAPRNPYKKRRPNEP
jgi:hypothetical protein